MEARCRNLYFEKRVQEVWAVELLAWSTLQRIADEMGDGLIVVPRSVHALVWHTSFKNIKGKMQWLSIKLKMYDSKRHCTIDSVRF